MSSLAATQADGYYLPPEYYDSGAYKKEGKNEWYKKNHQNHKCHKNQPQSTPQVVVRFELVDACVCESCGTRIGKGTRFNASKERVGSYLGNDQCPIYQFNTKCRICGHSFVIRTDPASRGFAYGPGIRQQQRQWDAHDVHGLVSRKGHYHEDDEEGEEEEEEHVLAQLEAKAVSHSSQSPHKQQRMTDLDQLKALQKQNKLVYFDDGLQNAKLRHVFRAKRRERQRQAQVVASMGWKSNLALLPDSVEDTCQAAHQTFGPSAHEKQHMKWRRLHESSIFAATKQRKRPHPTTIAPEPTSSSMVPCQPVKVEPLTSSEKSPIVKTEQRKRRNISLWNLTKQERSTLQIQNDTHDNPPAQSISVLSSMLDGYESSSEEES